MDENKSERFYKIVGLIGGLSGVVCFARQLSLFSSEAENIPKSEFAVQASSNIQEKISNLTKGLKSQYYIDLNSSQYKPTSNGELLKRRNTPTNDIPGFNQLNRTAHITQQTYINCVGDDALKKAYQGKKVTPMLLKDGTYQIAETKEVSSTSQDYISQMYKNVRMIKPNEFVDIELFYRPIVSGSTDISQKVSQKRILIDLPSDEVIKLNRIRELESVRCERYFSQYPRRPIASNVFYSYYNPAFDQTIKEHYGTDLRVFIKFKKEYGFKYNNVYNRRYLPSEIRVIDMRNILSEDEIEKIITAHFGNECSNIIVDTLTF